MFELLQILIDDVNIFLGYDKLISSFNNYLKLKFNDSQ